MSRFVLILLAVSSATGPVVIRHDVNDSRYRVPASAFPALTDLPSEGHGVLIAPQWIVRANPTQPPPHGPSSCVQQDHQRAR